jgi:hypothetical protein
MPRKEIDYSKTVIYKIICKDVSITDTYVGHTTNFTQRKQQHKANCLKHINTKLYEIINNHGGWENWDMLEIAQYTCKNVTEARIKENEHYEQLKASSNLLPFVDKLNYCCQTCNFTTNDSILYENHIQSIKHIQNITDTDSKESDCPKYVCTICDYYTSKKSSIDKHNTTTKHIQLANLDNSMICEESLYTCLNCNKNYKSRTGLWKHNKQCKPTQVEEVEKKVEDIDLLTSDSNQSIVKSDQAKQTQPQPDLNVIMEFVKQQLSDHVETNKNNMEFQKQSLDNQMQMFQQMMEFMKQQCATTNNIVNGNINNNNNYTQFNLQVYLNETCKNAMTINDFLDYLQPTLQELEDTAHLGYVESISRIIMRGFKNLEEEELPFHCSDLKREHIYVKNPDKEWVKETDDKPLLLRFIKEVTRRNFNNIFAWQKQNPTWSNYSSKKNDLYNSIVENAMSGATEKEQNENYEKIIKNIMKNTVIDKSKKNKK